MKKYIQLQDSYDSKKGDIWEEDTEYIGYTNKCNGICSVKSTIENNPDWFAPYEEKKEYSKTWEDLKKISGSFIDDICNVLDTLGLDAIYKHKNIYATENQAKAALAEAQLSQLLKEIYEGENSFPDWKDEKAIKHCVTSDKNNLYVEGRVTTIDFIALPTQELAEQFLKNHRDLIETYFKKFEW